MHIKCTATKKNTGKRGAGAEGKRRSEEELKEIVSNAHKDMEGEEELVDSSLYELTTEEKKNPKIEKVVIHRASYNLAQ